MEFPEPGDRRASHNGHGIDEVLQVVQRLSSAGIISCIVGGHALRYFGVRRAPETWDICVPNDCFEEATSIISEAKDLYKTGMQVLPQVKTLIHTYPRFKQIGVDFNFYIVPSFEYFMDDFNEDMFEYSNNGVPYPELKHYAQSLMSTQRWPELVHLIDGMDLSQEWGDQNLVMGFPTEREKEYVKVKNEKYMASCDDFPDCTPIFGTLSEVSRDRTAEWRAMVSGKKDRIRRFDKDTHITEFREKGSRDPRLRNDT
ncbi:hypothetical protein K461DRAFT_294969 [Myriangium duriaei CBS 260.36]|uniref:Uncharacterized protein n=1 Tax=Myriangium duriaei CBS 260.36 TaxID=1168546 RepID=A0A9P4MFA2_9PEZI|nr:hypothetical protein K461DRAFT_294969 [Myriangium duriaei CBS 260.36]